MKRFLSLFLIIVLIFSMVACSNEQTDDGGATKISFSQSVEELKKLDGKTVTINGFMSLLSPLNGSLIYLMNIPYQSCPFCIPNTNTLANTIAVKGENIELTPMPVKITGKLVFGKFSDSYGYEYSYRIQDAKVEVLDEKEISENIKVYYTVAQNGYLDELSFVIDCLVQVSFYKEYEIDPAVFAEYGEIPFEDYASIKATIEKLNTNGEYDDFLTMLDKTEENRININKELVDKNVDNYTKYKEDTNALVELFTEYVTKYEF